MKILITGFEVFGEHDHNPTAQLVEALNNKKVSSPPNVEVQGIILPVTFDTSFQNLQKRITEFNPDIILAFGLAARRETIEFERVAINCMDAYIPDNSGVQPMDLKIDEGGETAYFSSLPMRELQTALKVKGIPSRISNSAGTYVCNYVFYKLMQENTTKTCGFIHVPFMAIEDLSNALEAMLAELGH